MNKVPYRIVMALVISCVYLAVSESISFAWHGPGHMATALIAFLQLGPTRAHAVADVLRSHPDYPTWMADRPSSIPEDEYLFMRAATWPDEIRATSHPRHNRHQRTWHYVNKLFKVPPMLPDPTPEAGLHIGEAVTRNQDILSKNPTTKKERQERAMAVCWIIHLLGDVHQPLHTAALVSSQFPDGDQGGNAFWVKTNGGITQLHTYWDGLWDRLTATDAAQSKPRLSEKDLDPVKVVTLAKRIAKAYPRGALSEITSTNSFDGFVDESFDLARSTSYLDGSLLGATGVGQSHRNPPPSAPAVPSKYEGNALTLGERRLAIGGYRLADELSTTLGL